MNDSIVDALQLFRFENSLQQDFEKFLHKFKNICFSRKINILDIGSNCGAFMSYMSRHYDIEDSLMFEPIPRYHKICEERFSYNDRIQAFCFALSNDDCETKRKIWISDPSYSNNFGWNTMVEEKINKKNSKESVEVSSIRLDSRDDLYQFFDLVKIDVEGYEGHVILGMKGWFEKWQDAAILPAIFCEIGWGAGNPNVDLVIEAMTMLREFGYGVPNLKKITRTTNIIMYPNGKLDILGEG